MIAALMAIEGHMGQGTSQQSGIFETIAQLTP
jgi:hypothetical protein